MQTFIQQVEQLEDKLDSVVDHGSDDDLFIASYLQGHLALIAKPMEVAVDASLEKLDTALIESLEAAFDNKELSQEDQAKVKTLWQALIKQIR